MKKEVVIDIKNITKDYGHSRGNFNINLKIYKGETIGIMGENGAGKTTLLREIMGFIKPDKGKISIYNFDALKDAQITKNYIGYIPGEINFPDLKTGNAFLKSYASLSSLDSNYLDRADKTIKRMQLDVTAYPKRMSKGMKQKTSIVASIMKGAPILIMDEPTTGLDPLMRDEFLNIVMDEKKKKTTIIMTSNTIEELEKVCDRVVFINKGKITCIVNCNEIRKRTLRDYKIEFINKKDYEEFSNYYKKYIIKDQPKYNQVTIRIEAKSVNDLLKKLNNKELKFLSQRPYSLQTYFDENLNKRS